MNSMTIGKLAKAADVGVETVRFYQRRGLLAEPDRAGGVRRYDQTVLDRLRFIRAAQTGGFTLKEIGELLVLDAVDDRSKARVMAEEQICNLDRKIIALQAARDALVKLANECGRDSGGPCPILRAFATET